MRRSDLNLTPKWYTTAQVAELLGFGLYKTKALIASGELRSLKDGGIAGFCRSGSTSTSLNERRGMTHDRTCPSPR